MFKQSWKLLVCHIEELVSIPNYTTLHTHKDYIILLGFCDIWDMGRMKYILRKKWFCPLNTIWTTNNFRLSLGGASGEEPACQCRRHKRCRFTPWVGKIPWKRALQPALAWRIPWTEEPGRLQSLGSKRVGHDWSDLAFTHSRWYSYEDKIVCSKKVK